MGIFHEYDIRGIYGQELNEKFAYKLGKAILKYTKAKKIIICYDSRIGNFSLFSSISKAIVDEGVNVVHAGIITRPMLNYIAIKEKYDLGIMITASHNPSEYNGFKFIYKGKLLYYRNGLNEVEKIVQKLTKSELSASKKKKGKIISIDYIDQYVKFLSKQLSMSIKNSRKNLRIVGDISNGSAGEIAKNFLLKNNFTFKLLNSEPDGNFPAHNPNPLHTGATVELSKEVRKFNANIGFIVDPDADRIMFVDENGDVISNNYIDCLIVENLPKNSTVVYDVIARKILEETVAKKKMKGVATRVGTCNIIDGMSASKAIYGCETSGHRYYKIMSNQDSALLSLVFVLNIMGTKKLSKLLSKYHKYHDLGEMNYKVTRDKKEIIAGIEKIYGPKANKVDKLDGVKIIYDEYWFSMRPSNTENLLRLRIEGVHKKQLLALKKNIEKLIK